MLITGKASIKVKIETTSMMNKNFFISATVVKVYLKIFFIKFLFDRILSKRDKFVCYIWGSGRKY